MADTRILLVDDEKEVTALLAKRLVRRGYQCDTACRPWKPCANSLFPSSSWM